MGNCQAAEAAEVIIQHPGGKVERLYWPTPAADVMKSHPGHYVALVILRLSPDDKALTGDEAAAAGGGGAAKITRVKLLKPKDTLHLGQVYRLITAHGDEGAQGEEERQDAAVRGHQAAARPAAARRRGRPGRLREGREAGQQGPAPEPRRRAGAGAAGRGREGPELAAVAAEHLRGRGGPEQQQHR